MPITIPLALKSALEAGNCVLFLGAGIGYHMTAADGSKLPDAKSLAGELAVQFGIPLTTGQHPSLSKISQLVEIRKGRPSLDDFLIKRLANAEPDDVLGWITSKRWRAIYTTNYDYGIPRAYEKNAKPPQTPKIVSKTSELTSLNDFEVPIIYLHGALFGAKGQVVITEKDYTRFREGRAMLFELLKNHFATSPFLYIGYSNSDPNWSLLLDEVEEEFSPSRPPRSFRVAPNQDALEEEILEARNIQTIHADMSEFVSTAQAVLNELEIDSDRVRHLKNTIPPDLRKAFDRNPASAARLLNSWDYVNQTDFSRQSNLTDFLRGDRPNWSLISEGKFFKRDIEVETFDAALDYITSDSTKPGIVPILAPAGYGVTTLLMALAVRSVQEGAGRVFFHRPASALLEGDIEFALSIFGESVIFVIDDAAHHGSELNKVISRLREDNARALFILGSRLNEWAQNRMRISSKAYPIDPLSDDEIDRLLKLLESNNALGRLSDLTEDLRFASIRTRSKSELLVALREATEGIGFDSIIEDEFRKIGTDKAREAYLTVCCANQFGGYVRDAALADSLKLSTTELYQAISKSTDGVIVFDEVDQINGVFAARARHSTIARIVWERSGNSATKDAILQRSLELLNLNYRIDAEAFENFVRTDRLIDSIRTFDDKTRFFETACRKDPESPYVRQHYARMLLRADKPELALSQIEEGFALNPKSVPKVLVHTKGVILTELAISIESSDIARKRMVQAEQVFRAAILRSPKDDYAHTSLATLYLKWAKRSTITDEESLEYLAKAEGAVSEGLRACTEKDSLWVVASEIEHWLGNQPSRLKALQKAVKDNPLSVVPRFLLGRLLRHQGDFAGALDTLKPIIENHPDEFRAAQEYALALLEGGAKVAEAIAILRLAETYGLSELRFISLLGGLYFLDKQFDRAKEVFAASDRREFAYDELQTIYFRPPPPAFGAKPFEGRVVRTGPSYVFIEAQGYPIFFCPQTRIGNRTLRTQDKVQFHVGFAARGQRACSIMLV